MLEKGDVLVLVPAFNEAGSISKTIQGLSKIGLDFVIIDDGSIDDTAKIAEEAGSRVLRLPINLGVGGALRTGFQYACKHGYSAIIQVDADGQHPVNEIEDLIAAANNHSCHMVIGSRFRSDTATMKVSKVRRLPMRVLARSASVATGVQITDATSGFRLIQQPLLGEFARSFPAYYLGDTYEAIVSAGRSGYLVREIPAALLPREVGESSASIAQAVKFTLKSLSVAILRIHCTIQPFEQKK
jgi:glycosyltransferase involved in cell wall biosynthesis